MKRIRSLIRLFQLFLITTFYVSYYFISGIFKGYTREHMTHVTMLWGKALVKHSNIKVKLFGTIPENGVLFVSNHRSYIDIALIAQYVPCTFLSKAEVATWPVIGLAARAVKVLFVKREDPESRREARKLIHATVDQGISVIIFPEGTANIKNDIMPFRQGVFKVAADGDFKIIPIAIILKDMKHAWGEESFLSHFIRTFKEKEIHFAISFGDIIKDNDPDHLMKTCWHWINNEIKRKIAWQ